MTKHKDVDGEDCDMLVIGGLFGGNVAAVELTEKGDRLRISAVWRKRPTKDSAETAWDIKRSVCPRRGLAGIRRIYSLVNVMAHAGVGIGSRVLLRMRNSRPPTNGARTASTDSEPAVSVLPTTFPSNTTATIYPIAQHARRS
ncbi:Choline dehydrogenase or related flavoprotein [Mycobacterium rhizamassiliense]|jgi:hypothetical protein|uniref:Choline dehydrogenase or related flavoprotein n=1 Tax=Mycobacterium rhizamassiliense TaxID=1841860 RepID=A0A2U3NXH2_9MYCO|nr:Choline dehydrogenase or related flavoprotein [Mycobacterium rhizamassiliense]